MNAKVVVFVFCVLLICFSSASAYSSHFRTTYEVQFYYNTHCSSYQCGYACYGWWRWWWWWWYPFGYGCYYRRICYTCSSVRESRSVARQTCEAYWTGPNCNIPYCTPACAGGKTCTSENDARPTCKCLTADGAKCKAVGCTNPQKSCYPGTCDGSQRCMCPPEFTGDNCQTMLKTPEISNCNVKLFSGNPESEVASANCAVEGHEAEIVWVSKDTFSRIEPSFETKYMYPYEPVLATETLHIKDARFGVDSTRVEVVLFRPTGAPISKDVPHCKAEGTKPEQHFDCSRRSIQFSEFGQNSLPTNTTINITISSRLGGYKILRSDAKEPIRGQNVSERRVAFKVDATPPAHCRRSRTCNDDPPISVPLDAVKDPVVEFTFTNWFDHDSGIKSYDLRIYELLKSNSARDPILQRVNKPKDQFSIEGNINKKQYTFPAPGVYSVELTVFDYADNNSTARKIMFYDNANRMEIKQEQLFIVEQASKESGYRWITDALRNDNGFSRLSLSWKGRYSNSKHVQEGWLSRVEAWTEGGIDDDLTNGVAVRTIHQIANANGTAFYKLAFKVDQQVGLDFKPTGFVEGVNLTDKEAQLPESTWMSLASDVSSKEIVMPKLTGNDTVVIFMRAFDAVGHYVEDKVLVRFDTSEPVLVGDSPAVLRPNSPDQYQSSVVITANDMESGIDEVKYYIRDASLKINITSGSAKARRLNKSGAGRRRRRRSAVCNPTTDATCYCINGGECFENDIVVVIDHCVIDKYYAVDRQMQFHYVVINQAGKSVAPRDPFTLNFASGKPNCRAVEEFTAGTILAIVIGLLVLVVLVVLVVFMVLRYQQHKHPLPDRVRTFATSVRQRITNTEKVLDSEGRVLYRTKTRRGRQVEDDDDIYVDGSDPGGWRVNRDQVEVAETLAEGRFAVVKKAYLKKGGKTTTVAMKYLPSGASESDKALLKAKIAFHGNKVPPHDNIVRLIGVLDEGPVMLLEFCDMTLKDWLSKVNKVDTDALENMLNFTMHIASGMEHLHSKSIVHRRLAMRNVLLKNDGMNGLVAKLIGFGTFNDVGADDGAAEATANVAVPLKWLAPETLESVGKGKAVYTQKSDVWAYGVTIWEIYSLGATPYSGKKSAEVEALLKTGYRMPKPDECPPELFDSVVAQCWNATPKRRPDFKNILKQIRDFRSGGDSQEGYYAVDGKPSKPSTTYDNPRERTADYISGKRGQGNPYAVREELYDDTRK